MSYLWRNPQKIQRKDIAIYESGDWPGYIEFKNGQPISEKIVCKPRLTFNNTLNKLNSFKILPNGSRLPIVHSSVLPKIESFLDNVEIIEVIVQVKGKEIQDYFLINVLNKTKCINHTKSKFSYVSGTSTILGFQKLSLIIDAPSPFHIARDIESFNLLIISKKLAEIIGSYKGLWLANPEDVYP